MMIIASADFQLTLTSWWEVVSVNCWTFPDKDQPRHHLNAIRSYYKILIVICGKEKSSIRRLLRIGKQTRINPSFLSCWKWNCLVGDDLHVKILVVFPLEYLIVGLWFLEVRVLPCFWEICQYLVKRSGVTGDEIDHSVVNGEEENADESACKWDAFT